MKSEQRIDICNISVIFDTSMQNVDPVIINVLDEKELNVNSVVKYFLTTAEFRAK